LAKVYHKIYFLSTIQKLPKSLWGFLTYKLYFTLLFLCNYSLTQ
jgi:hypothetical protein